MNWFSVRSRCGTALLLTFLSSTPALGASLTYVFSGEITEISSSNEAHGVSLGDPFNGYMTFDSDGWHSTAGTVQATLNGVNLLFTGESIYGGVTAQPGGYYSLRVAADTGGSIDGSSFSAGNFGPEIEDRDGSAGIAESFPAAFDLSEFETNILKIFGTYLPTNTRYSVSGTLTSLQLVPEPASLLTAMCGMLIVAAVPRHRQPVSPSKSGVDR
ncbi:hypothetical protein [Pseudobythopirellula maris]|nr:hypothetical protein [Pseudobythopirellula maris]